MTEPVHISQRSEGPTPDALELKLSGSTGLPLDLKRSQEVEIIVRGVVSGHTFTDKRGSSGDVEVTVKSATVKVDELVSVTVLEHKRRNAPAGQTAFTNGGDTVDASTGDLVRVGDDEDVVDVEIVDETRQLPRGETPEGVDRETGEIRPDLDRHPQVPEQAWGELNHEQKAEVLDLVGQIDRTLEYLSSAVTPTDRQAAEGKLERLTGLLLEDFGVELIPADQVMEADDVVAPASEPPPPPITAQSPPLTAEKLIRRREYLRAKRALPPEAAAARNEELAEIDRRLDAQAGIDRRRA